MSFSVWRIEHFGYIVWANFHQYYISTPANLKLKPGIEYTCKVIFKNLEPNNINDFDSYLANNNITGKLEIIRIVKTHATSSLGKLIYSFSNYFLEFGHDFFALIMLNIKTDQNYQTYQIMLHLNVIQYVIICSMHINRLQQLFLK